MTVIYTMSISLLNTLFKGSKINLYVIESYTLVLSVFVDNFSSSKRDLKFLPLINTVFYLILSYNLIGLIPYSFTSTSHMSTTSALSLTLFSGITLKGIKKHKVNFFNLFLPAAPWPLLPLLTPIELLSYFIRGFSLAIRLFANMMAGHALLKILAGFVWDVIINVKSSWISILILFFPILVIIGITGLELGVACLQAFVFVVLLVVYLKEVTFLH